MAGGHGKVRRLGRRLSCYSTDTDTECSKNFAEYYEVLSGNDEEQRRLSRGSKSFKIQLTYSVRIPREALYFVGR